MLALPDKTMVKRGAPKGNQNASLKPGEIGRVQWTEHLSGEVLIKFIQHYEINPQLSEKELRKQVADKARELFEKTTNQILGIEKSNER